MVLGPFHEERKQSEVRDALEFPNTDVNRYVGNGL
jgi:hypothetical protein